jgi:predicted NAD/FAD-dependent oxidoreductase
MLLLNSFDDTCQEAIMPDLAIIGAGVAGLAAARALRQRQPDLAITIYEQSHELGGRVATRRRDGYIFDHGAQNLRAPTPELTRLLTAELPSEQLRDIGLPVWTFDGAGVLAEGDPAQNADPKWIYRDGLDRLGELLGAGLEIRREVHIRSFRRKTKDERRKDSVGDDLSSFVLRPSSVSYELFDIQGQKVAEANMILLTPPAPQTAEILAASELDAVHKDALLAELAHASYRRCISLAVACPRPIERPFYALVNTDRAHAIAWLALEHAKAPERCPPGHSLLIAQMASQWSLDHWHAPVEQLERLVVPQVAALLGEDLGAPLWADVQHWPYALPDRGADFAILNGASGELFFAGDYTTGLGRVHLAIESGWRVAEQIHTQISHG